MRYLLLLLFCYFRSIAQPNVHIQGHFEGFPSSQYRVFVTKPAVLSIYNYTPEETAVKEQTDQCGSFKKDLRLESPQKVTVECLGYQLDFFLKPNDTLYFVNPNRSHSPVIKGPTAPLQRFLYESMLLGKDSLCQKPLFQHMSLEDYSFVVNDLSALAWERYQRDCDTGNVAINSYVRASLEGQKFLRKQTYIRSQGEQSKNETISLNVLGDEALISDIYTNALYSHWVGYLPTPFMNRNVVFQIDSTVWEGRYNAIYEGLRKFPKTRELMLAHTVRRSVSFISFSTEKEITVPTKLFERFKEDFPHSSYTNVLAQDILDTSKRMKRMPPPQK